MKLVQAVRCTDTLSRVPALLTTHYTQQMADIWEFGVNVALRISDTLAIRVSDIKNNVLTVKEGKTNKAARIVLNIKAQEVVRRTLKDYPDTVYLFQSRRSRNRTGAVKALTRQAVGQAFKAIGEIINVDLSTHSMRKTRGYHVYHKSGKDIGLVSKILRHSNTGVTLRYIGIEQDDIDQSFNDYVF